MFSLVQGDKFGTSCKGKKNHYRLGWGGCHYFLRL